MLKIAFLGLGAMGSRMAKHLLNAGHELVVWNRSQGRADELLGIGAKEAESPYQAALGADVVISMVRDDEASRSVWLDPSEGALRGMNGDAIAIECSTLTPAWVETFSSHCEERGLAFVDAPLAGSRPQAEAAQLIFFVGATEEAFDRVSPLLSTMGAKVNHVGPVSSGAKVKLVVNTLFAQQLAGVAELLGYLHKTNIDVGKAMEVICATPVCSPASANAINGMLNKNFAAAFPIELVEKDLAYMTSTAESVSASLKLSSATRRVFADAMAAGLGNDNITGVVQLYL